MKLPTILKGADAASFTIAAPEALAEFVVRCAGARRVFYSVASGQSCAVAFTAEETARMPLGVSALFCHGQTAAGVFKSYPVTVRVCVTDSPEEVTSAPVAVDALSVSPLTSADSLSTVKTAVNAIITRLGGVSAALALLLSWGAGAFAAALSFWGAGLAPSLVAALVLIAQAPLAPSSAATLDAMPGTNEIYTAAETRAYVASTVASAGSVTPEMVSNAVAQSGHATLAQLAAVSNLAANAAASSAISNLVISATNAVVPAAVARSVAAVTNEVFTAWVASGFPTGATPFDSQPTFSPYSSGGGYWVWLWNLPGEGVIFLSSSSGSIPTSEQSENDVYIDFTTLTATRRRVNALSLARLADLAAVLTAQAPLAQFATNAYATATNVARQVSQWTTYWDGDDVRVTVTNYDSTVRIPSLYLEQKVTEGGSNYFKRVWDERTRWNNFTPGYETFTNATVAALDDKADRAWGCYDSTTGEYAPDGYTWISSSNVAICADMAWQRTITTSGGAIWILSSTGLDTVVSGTEAGKFSISDDDGNALFSIVKGDKRTVGASAASNLVTQAVGGGTEMRIFYPVVSESCPTIFATTNLVNAVWKAESDSACPCAVAWSGTSGAYWAQVIAPEGVNQLFVKASAVVGGETYVRHDAPIAPYGGMTVTNTAAGGYITVYPKWNGTTVIWSTTK